MYHYYCSAFTLNYECKRILVWQFWICLYVNGGRGICCDRFIFDRYWMIFLSGKLLFLFTDEYKIASSDIWWHSFSGSTFSFCSRFWNFTIEMQCDAEDFPRARFITVESNFLINETIRWNCQPVTKEITSQDTFTISKFVTHKSVTHKNHNFISLCVIIFKKSINIIF